MIANSEHLPAVLVHRDGAVERVGEARAQPLGVAREFPQRRCAFPRGSDLVLYTDGLVESRPDVEVGYEALAGGLVALRAWRDGSSVTVVVADQGRWKPAEPGGGTRGRGLAHRSEVTSGDAGTMVTMTWSPGPDGS